MKLALLSNSCLNIRSSIYIYIYIYIYVCVCVCVCVRERERERERKMKDVGVRFTNFVFYNSKFIRKKP